MTPSSLATWYFCQLFIFHVQPTICFIRVKGGNHVNVADFLSFTAVHGLRA